MEQDNLCRKPTQTCSCKKGQQPFTWLHSFLEKKLHALHLLHFTLYTCLRPEIFEINVVCSLLFVRL